MRYEIRVKILSKSPEKIDYKTKIKKFRNWKKPFVNLMFQKTFPILEEIIKKDSGNYYEIYAYNGGGGLSAQIIISRLEPREFIKIPKKREVLINLAANWDFDWSHGVNNDNTKKYCHKSIMSDEKFHELTEDFYKWFYPPSIKFGWKPF